MPVSTSLGAALKRWRHSAGLHQVDVARTAEVSQPTISASEAGTFSGLLLIRLIAIYKPRADELHDELVAAGLERLLSDGGAAADTDASAAAS